MSHARDDPSLPNAWCSAQMLNAIVKKKHSVLEKKCFEGSLPSQFLSALFVSTTFCLTHFMALFDCASLRDEAYLPSRAAVCLSFVHHRLYLLLHQRNVLHRIFHHRGVRDHCFLTSNQVDLHYLGSCRQGHLRTANPDLLQGMTDQIDVRVDRRLVDGQRSFAVSRTRCLV